MTSRLDDPLNVANSGGKSFPHGISNRPSLAIIEAAPPEKSAFASLHKPSPTTTFGHPLPVGTDGAGEVKYLAVGVALLPGKQLPGWTNFLVVARLDQTSGFVPTKKARTRQFYALC